MNEFFNIENDSWGNLNYFKLRIALKQLEAPIKEQYVFIILGIPETLLGYVLKRGVAWASYDYRRMLIQI